MIFCIDVTCKILFSHVLTYFLLFLLCVLVSLHLCVCDLGLNSVFTCVTTKGVDFVANRSPFRAIQNCRVDASSVLIAMARSFVDSTVGSCDITRSSPKGRSHILDLFVKGSIFYAPFCMILLVERCPYDLHVLPGTGIEILDILRLFCGCSGPLYIGAPRVWS